MSNDGGKERFGQLREESFLSPLRKDVVFVLHLADLGDNMSSVDEFFVILERGDCCKLEIAERAVESGALCLLSRRRSCRSPFFGGSKNVGDFFKINLVGDTIGLDLDVSYVSHDPYNRFANKRDVAGFMALSEIIGMSAMDFDETSEVIFNVDRNVFRDILKV